MPISTTSNRISYDGDGTTVEFSVPFLFFNDSDLVVIEKNDTTGIETTKSLTTHYTVSGADEASGGAVTMVSAPAVGTSLIIKREVDYTQSTEFVDNSALRADTVNDAFDKATMMAQQLKEITDRCIQIPSGEDETLQLPNKVSRAGKALTFDSNGDASASQLVDYTEFYNKNELDAGQLDNRYYTESEVDTLNDNANATTLKGYSVETPQASYDGYYLQWNTTTSGWTIVSGTGGGVRDHDQLGNLDYASAGHTGFVSSTSLNSVSGTLNTKIDTISGTLNTNLLNNVQEDTSPSLGGNLDTNGNSIKFANPSSDHTNNGIYLSSTVSGATGYGEPLYADSTGYHVADCSNENKMTCIALSTASGTGTQNILLMGLARDDSWAFSPGDTIYVSTGTLTNTAPSTTDYIVQSVGYCVATGIIMFRPDMTYGKVA